MCKTNIQSEFVPKQEAIKRMRTGTITAFAAQVLVSYLSNFTVWKIGPKYVRTIQNMSTQFKMFP